MLRQQRPKSKINRVRFPGICELAKRLNVDRVHVWRVLKGERISPRVEAAARQQWPDLFPPHKCTTKSNKKTQPS